ncbi:DnaJ-like subfamily B member 12 isoform A [Senna tora]|uniref:shikimate dehydrogenase (NADP(+)) n=1 Tax=Senna tora TaxID=362788 RepID=A0A835CDZ9_9FABA|nr:DnaJ-like subfamily B member 12 isoform A [Senna tora]
MYDGDENKRLDALRLAVELGADYVDVEVKVPVIGIAMGERGVMSRILCGKFGGYMTYGRLECGLVSSPGEPTIKDLLHVYNFREIGADTKIFGVIGNPIAHSKSPFLYNQSFQSVGFDAVYLHFLVDHLPSFLRTYSSTDFAGFSVGIPHKETALKCCDEVNPVAKSIGAVNCIIRRSEDGKLSGYNTDYFGAISAIEDALRGKVKDSSMWSPLTGRLFVVIGAGGAGKALAYGAKQKGARVVIANRTYDRARELANTIGGDALALSDLNNYHPEDAMILANATSIGMQPKVDETPISKHALKFYSLVFDAVYTPKMTRLLKEAEESGATIVTGMEMLIGQAYEQYESTKGAFQKNYDKLLMRIEIIKLGRAEAGGPAARPIGAHYFQPEITLASSLSPYGISEISQTALLFRFRHPSRSFSPRLRLSLHLFFSLKSECSTGPVLMDCNREEALRAKVIAEKKMESKDFTGARKIALKAQQLYPDLENIAQMLIVCEVHCSAEQKLFGNEMDWYGILKVEQTADEATIKKQYRKFALQLHPDKNKFAGAEAAFKLIGEAQGVLLDKNKRAMLDMRCRFPVNRTARSYHPAQKVHTNSNPGFQNNVKANFSNLNPQQQQQPPRQQTQQGPNGSRPTFWTACPFCSSRYEFYRDAINKSFRCPTCGKIFIASDVLMQGKSPAANSGQKAFCQQKYDLNQGASKVDIGSQDSSDSEEEMGVDKDGIPDGLNHPNYSEEPPRRSMRQKQQVIYKENVSDDDDDNLNPSTRAKGSDSSLDAGEDYGETAKMNNQNGYKNDDTVDMRGKEAARCSKGTEDSASKETEDPTFFNYPDAEFSDFVSDKNGEYFESGQIWAIYDTVDGMPRFYALIRKVISPGFRLRITWFEAEPDDKDEMCWVEKTLPVACGKYRFGHTEVTEDRLMFSHLILCKKIGRSNFNVYPRKGETWALYKNWDIKWYINVESHQKYEYEFVEILSDYVEGKGVSVAYLDKLKGFVSLFSRTMKGVECFQIPSVELYRFSHRVPSHKMTGQEREGVPEGSFELDPAALPMSLLAGCS